MKRYTGRSQPNMSKRNSGESTTHCFPCIYALCIQYGSDCNPTGKCPWTSTHGQVHGYLFHSSSVHGQVSVYLAGQVHGYLSCSSGIHVLMPQGKYQDVSIHGQAAGQVHVLCSHGHCTWVLSMDTLPVNSPVTS